MSFPRDAILGTGFAPQGRACPIAPNARPIYNKREAPSIRTLGDMIRAKMPHLWPQIVANCKTQGTDSMLREPVSQWDQWAIGDIIAMILNWSKTPEGFDFWSEAALNA